MNKKTLRLLEKIKTSTLVVLQLGVLSKDSPLNEREVGLLSKHAIFLLKSARKCDLIADKIK